MRNFLLFLAAIFVAAISMNAQTGNPISEEPSQTEYIPFIQEDKVWEYAKTTFPNSDFYVLYDMRFDGVVDVNGHVYSRFVNFKATKYPNGLDNEGNELTQEELMPTSYFREEGKTVYILMEDGVPAVGVIDLSADYSEAVMMDYSLADGSPFPLGLFPQYDDAAPLYIHYRDYPSGNFATDGKCFELYSIDSEGMEIVYHPVFGESIGLINDILPNIDLYWSTGTMESFLLCVRQGEKILYKDSRYDGITSVRSVYSDTSVQLYYKNGIIEATGIESDDTLELYDANGRLLSSAAGRSSTSIATNALQPGVYVAKAGTKTLKILVK